VLIFGNKAQTIGNAGVEPSIVTTQPLNKFYDPFSSLIQKEMSALSSSKMIPTKTNTTANPIISNSPLYLLQTASSSNSPLYLHQTASSSNSPLYLHQTASSSNTATPVPSESERTFLTPNSSMQNINTEPKSYHHITQDHTVVIDKTTYKIVSLPASRIRAVNIGTNSPGKQPSINVIEVCIIHQYIIFTYLRLKILIFIT